MIEGEAPAIFVSLVAVAQRTELMHDHVLIGWRSAQGRKPSNHGRHRTFGRPSNTHSSLDRPRLIGRLEIPITGPGLLDAMVPPLKIGKVGFLGKSIPPIAQSLRASTKAAPLLGRSDEDQHEMSS